MSISKRFHNLKGKQQKGDATELIVRVMKYFTWNLSDIKDLKLPSFMVLLNNVNKIEKDRSKKDGQRKDKLHSRGNRV